MENLPLAFDRAESARPTLSTSGPPIEAWPFTESQAMVSFSPDQYQPDSSSCSLACDSRAGPTASSICFGTEDEGWQELQADGGPACSNYPSEEDLFPQPDSSHPFCLDCPFGRYSLDLSDSHGQILHDLLPIRLRQESVAEFGQANLGADAELDTLMQLPTTRYDEYGLHLDSQPLPTHILQSTLEPIPPARLFSVDFFLSNNLASSAGQPWRGTPPVAPSSQSPTPTPTYSIGFSATAFPPVLWRRLDLFLQSEFCMTNGLCFPFFIYEFNGLGETMDSTQKQNIHNVAIALRQYLKLFERARMLEQIDRLCLVVSVIHADDFVVFWAHYPEFDGSTWAARMAPIASFPISADAGGFRRDHDQYIADVCAVYAQRNRALILQAVGCSPSHADCSGVTDFV